LGLFLFFATSAPAFTDDLFAPPTMRGEFGRAGRVVGCLNDAIVSRFFCFDRPTRQPVAVNGCRALAPSYPPSKPPKAKMSVVKRCPDLTVTEIWRPLMSDDRVIE